MARTCCRFWFRLEDGFPRETLQPQCDSFASELTDYFNNRKVTGNYYVHLPSFSRKRLENLLLFFVCNSYSSTNVRCLSRVFSCPLLLPYISEGDIALIIMLEFGLLVELNKHREGVTLGSG